MQKNITLLYIVTKLELGGAQKQLLTLIKQLDKNKYNIYLITAKEGLLLPVASSLNGLTIKRSRFLDRPINPLKDILALIEIYWFIKKNAIRIVHTHSSKAGIVGRLAAKLAKVNIIFHTVHGWSFNDYQAVMKRKIFLLLERFAAKFTDRLIVVSCCDKQKGLENFIGTEDKYFLIRYGIDQSEFKRSHDYIGIRKELKISATDTVVGMIACFKPQKSPQDFIKLAYAVKETFPSVKFVLVGDGILRKKIENLISGLNLKSQVLLTGWRKDVPMVLAAMDIFVLTSLWEGLPIVVLEAMASAKPIVVTDTGGVGEVINDGKAGFVVPPGDTKKMVEKLALLLHDGDLRRRMGQYARDRLDSNFTVRAMVRHSENLYANLLNQKEVQDVN
jgi:glycosyltransferase involved in cell wall biosynthesis